MEHLFFSILFIQYEGYEAKWPKREIVKELGNIEFFPNFNLAFLILDFLWNFKATINKFIPFPNFLWDNLLFHTQTGCNSERKQGCIIIRWLQCRSGEESPTWADCPIMWRDLTNPSAREYDSKYCCEAQVRTIWIANLESHFPEIWTSLTTNSFLLSRMIRYLQEFLIQLRSFHFQSDDRVWFSHFKCGLRVRAFLVPSFL